VCVFWGGVVVVSLWLVHTPVSDWLRWYAFPPFESAAPPPPPLPPSHPPPHHHMQTLKAAGFQET